MNALELRLDFFQIPAASFSGHTAVSPHLLDMLFCTHAEMAGG